MFTWAARMTQNLHAGCDGTLYASTARADEELPVRVARIAGILAIAVTANRRARPRGDRVLPKRSSGCRPWRRGRKGQRRLAARVRLPERACSSREDANQCLCEAIAPSGNL